MKRKDRRKKKEEEGRGFVCKEIMRLQVNYRTPQANRYVYTMQGHVSFVCLDCSVQVQCLNLSLIYPCVYIPRNLI